MIGREARVPRPVVFVCLGQVEGRLVSAQITEQSSALAEVAFFDQFRIKPETIYGPFRPKKVKLVSAPQALRFTDQVKKAEYQGWSVNASYLAYPKDHAFLLFVRRLDGKKQVAPKGTTIVPIKELKLT